MDYHATSGIIPDFVDSTTLQQWVSILQKFDTTIQKQPVDYGKNEDYENPIGFSHGIDGKNIKGFMWFDKVILNRIRKYFDPSLLLIFGHYATTTIPIKIHGDTFPDNLPDGASPYKSFLIPVSVDGDTNLCYKSSTITVNPGEMSNADYLKHFTHQDEEIKNLFQIDKVLEWKSGNLLWWDNTQWHASNNFNTTSKTKESIVIHTYVR